MSMNIYANRGQKVIVTKVTAHNGYSSDEKQVADKLKIGKIYTVRSTHVERSSTVRIDGFDFNFNTVMFIDYVDAPKEEDFMEANGSGLNLPAFEFAKRKWVHENQEQIEARAMYKEGVTKLESSEIIVSSIKVYDKNANGCIRHQKHAMISYKPEGKETVYDLFLDEEQAKGLFNHLKKIV